jgi:hypothetical protein
MEGVDLPTIASVTETGHHFSGAGEWMNRVAEASSAWPPLLLTITCPLSTRVMIYKYVPIFCVGDPIYVFKGSMSSLVPPDRVGPDIVVPTTSLLRRTF